MSIVGRMVVMMPKKPQRNKKRGKRASQGKSNKASSVSRKRAAASKAIAAPKKANQQEADTTTASSTVQQHTAEHQAPKAAEPSTLDSTAARSKSKDKERAAESRSQPEQTARQSTEDHSMRTRELRSGAYRALQDACDKSKHLSGKLRQHRSAVLLDLPSSLPGSLIVRAINKSGLHYQLLHADRIAAASNQQPQLELFVDGLNDDQLTTLIAELDELIGDFTGRN